MLFFLLTQWLYNSRIKFNRCRLVNEESSFPKATRITTTIVQPQHCHPLESVGLLSLFYLPERGCVKAGRNSTGAALWMPENLVNFLQLLEEIGGGVQKALSLKHLENGASQPASHPGGVPTRKPR